MNVLVLPHKCSQSANPLHVHLTDD